MKEILVFGCRDEKDIKRLQNALVLQQISVRRIEKEKYGYPLECLLDEEGQQGIEESDLGMEYQGKKLAVPVMVLAGFSMEELDPVLALVRQNLPGNSYLKAVLTEQNRKWNILILSAHLQEEHRRMKPNPFAVLNRQP